MVPVHPPGHGGEKRCEEIPLRPVSVLSASCRPVAPSPLLELCAAVRASALKSELVNVFGFVLCAAFRSVSCPHGQTIRLMRSHMILSGLTFSFAV
jgi:hypothetical protein